MPGKFEKSPSDPHPILGFAARGSNYVIYLVCLLVWLASPPCLAQEPIRIGLSLGLTGRFTAISDYIRIHHGESPGYHAGLAYAAGQELHEAIRDAGCLDRDKVRGALFRLDTMTIIGRFAVDETGKQIRQHAFIIQWQKGRKKLVWPQEIKTAEPVFP